jgi:hypothetical protein
MYIILIPDHPQNLSVFLFHIIYKQTRPTKFHQIVDFAEIRIRHVFKRFEYEQVPFMDTDFREKYFIKTFITITKNVISQYHIVF